MAEEKFTLDNIKEEITTQLTQTLNFPIQSQHEGNCASDSIQIILTFSDLIGPAFAELALAMYYKVYLKQQKVDLMHLTTKQVQTMMDVGVSASDEELSTSYLLHSQIRYLKMMSDYKVKVQKNITTGLAVRMESVAGQAGVSSGTVCSLVFAIKNAQVNGRGIQTIKNALAYHYESKRNTLYGYTGAVYDPIIKGVLKTINIYLSNKLKKPAKYFQMVSGIPSGYDLSRIVGIQVFCMTDSNLFHTFTFFRFSGIWHIGDNEVGLATPTTWTIEDLVNNQISFKADMVGNEYTRTYYLTSDGKSDGKSERISVRYKLKKATSNAYSLCYESRAASVSNMFRRYFVTNERKLLSNYYSFVPLPLYREIEGTVRSFATYNGSPYTGYFSNKSVFLPYYPELTQAVKSGHAVAAPSGTGAVGAGDGYGHAVAVTARGPYFGNFTKVKSGHAVAARPPPTSDIYYPSDYNPPPTSGIYYPTGTGAVGAGDARPGGLATGYVASKKTGYIAEPPAFFPPPTSDIYYPSDYNPPPTSGIYYPSGTGAVGAGAGDGRAPAVGAAPGFFPAYYRFKQVWNPQRGEYVTGVDKEATEAAKAALPKKFLGGSKKRKQTRKAKKHNRKQTRKH